MLNAIMKKTFTILLLFVMTISFGQNIVPNASFEDTLSCPSGQNQVYKAIEWSSFGNTPDYFNACSQIANIPNTPAGFQNAASGNAFCGVYTYYTGPTGAPNYREYIGSQLTNALVIGQKYFVSFKINKPNVMECATNNFGALFSTVPFSYTNPTPFYKIPQIISNQIITDTLQWTTITDSFIADSLYKYIILGSFYSDLNTSTIIYNGHTDCIAYYYIDDICVSSDSLTCNSNTSIKEYYIKNTFNIYPNPTDQNTQKVKMNLTLRN
jgi:hypothetical protein